MAISPQLSTPPAGPSCVCASTWPAVQRHAPTLPPHACAGVVHWQHPRFFAYFSANTSFPAMLADMLASSLNMIGFSWAARCAPNACMCAWEVHACTHLIRLICTAAKLGCAPVHALEPCTSSAPALCVLLIVVFVCGECVTHALPPPSPPCFIHIRVHTCARTHWLAQLLSSSAVSLSCTQPRVN